MDYSQGDFIENEGQDEINNDHDTLILIFKYFEQVSQEQELDKVLNILMDLGCDLIQAERCTLWLIDNKKDIIYTRIAKGTEELVMQKNEGLVGYCIENGEELVVNDPYNDPRFFKQKDIETGYITREIITLPIKSSVGTVIGAFQALNKKGRNNRFTADDLQKLRLAASYAGKSIETAILNNELRETQKEIINLLGLLGEVRSLETRKHVARVANYSAILGEAYGLSKKDIEILKLASPMHDIGKVGIPDAILMKPGSLTEMEFEIMKSHTNIGNTILKSSQRELLIAAAVIANTHHERYNGSGYPNKLAGEEIPLFGRITAICDVFDALISERIYKRSWTLEEVIEYLKNEKGKHFDPKLVDLFLASIDKIKKVMEEYRDAPLETDGMNAKGLYNL